MVFLLRKLIKYAWLLMTFRCMDTPPFTIFTSGGWGMEEEELLLTTFMLP